MQISLKAKKQSANRALWRDAKKHRCEDIPLNTECRRLIDRVYAVFCSGCENWSWSRTGSEDAKNPEAITQDEQGGRNDTELLLQDIRKQNKASTSDSVHCKWNMESDGGGTGRH